MASTYTTPTLSKGKPVTVIPKGSTKAKEQAKRTWYVDFSYYNPSTLKVERFRVTNGGNRIKDPQEKLNHFTQLLSAYKELLANGYNPIDERSNTKLKRSVVSVTLAEAKELFEAYHNSKGTRRKSIQSYLSKVNAFIAFYGEHKKVNEITDYEITSFLNHQEAKYGWTGVTYVNSKIALNNYFKYLKVNKFIEVNPVTDTETRRKLKTESHQVFTDDDFLMIMDWLKASDPYALLFCRTIYYTCIRPKELRHLQLKHINLSTGIITVPTSIAKNKKAMPIAIDQSLMKEFVGLNINELGKELYLFGSTTNIVGQQKVGENTPYNRFRKCLKELKLTGKGYTLYSFKHMSNVRKFLAGWSVAQISKANRHSSINETETYLKDLLKFVEIDKSIPPI